jgi:hypothetical protein
MTKQELTALHQSLPYGSVKRIAETVGITPDAVGQVFRGKFKNERVVTAALNLLKETKEKEKAQSELLKELL